RILPFASGSAWREPRGAPNLCLCCLLSVRCASECLPRQEDVYSRDRASNRVARCLGMHEKMLWRSPYRRRRRGYLILYVERQETHAIEH
ncbi:hypothetical protein PLICRDRAFT_677637, partial [Plicaturopsis crispa FD-325 SS-3]